VHIESLLHLKNVLMCTGCIIHIMPAVIYIPQEEVFTFCVFICCTDNTDDAH